MITVNPVLGRELRERLRSGRAFAAITVFVGLLLLLTWAINTGSSNANPGDLSALTSTGRSLLDGLTFGMMFLMAFFLPGIAAGAISGERERETLIPLQVTLLSSRSILTGKILAASAFAALLLVAATPLFATAYLLGGVSLAEAVRTLVALGAIAVMITTIAVVCSSIVRRTQAAVLLAYTVTFFVFVAAPFIFGMASIVETRRNQPTGAPNGVTRALLLPNPVVALAAFAEPTAGKQDGSNSGPLASVRQGLRNDSIGQFRTTYFGIPDWLWSFGFLSVGTGLFTVLGVRALRTPARTER